MTSDDVQTLRLASAKAEAFSTSAANCTLIFMSTLIFNGSTLLTHWRSRLVAADAKSMNGGNPMLSTPPITKTLVNSTHAARRIAARIASAFVPTEHLAPFSHEALCYGCMAGIVMLLPHDIAPCDRGHDDREFRLNGDSTPTPQLHERQQPAVNQAARYGAHGLPGNTDDVPAGSPAHRRAEVGAANRVLKHSHPVRRSQYSHFNLEIHHHELP